MTRSQARQQLRYAHDVLQAPQECRQCGLICFTCLPDYLKVSREAAESSLTLRAAVALRVSSSSSSAPHWMRLSMSLLYRFCPLAPAAPAVSVAQHPGLLIICDVTDPVPPVQQLHHLSQQEAACTVHWRFRSLTALHNDDAEVVGDNGCAREVVLHRVDVHLVPQLRLCEALHLRSICMCLKKGQMQPACRSS